MIRSIRNALFTFVSMLCLVSVALPAKAELISTDKATSSAQSERERVKDLIARPEVAKKLETLGVLSKDAQARVDALTEEEVRALAARIDALPAGGLSDTNWLLIIIAVILILALAL